MCTFDESKTTKPPDALQRFKEFKEKVNKLCSKPLTIRRISRFRSILISTSTLHRFSTAWWSQESIAYINISINLTFSFWGLWFASLTHLQQSTTPTTPVHSQHVINDLSNTGIGESYFTRKKAELDHVGYSILINFADPLDSCSYIQEHARQPPGFPRMKLCDFLMLFKMPFLGEKRWRRKITELFGVLF